MNFMENGTILLSQNQLDMIRLFRYSLLVTQQTLLVPIRLGFGF